jgi:cytoskeletal protein CcmA (bactofilin family)
MSSRVIRVLPGALVTVAAFVLCVAPARADVHQKGAWPEAGAEHVTLSFNGSRADAISKLAEAAGWSVVVRGVPACDMNVEVKDQPAASVLELVLSDASYVATRTGNMIAIAPEAPTVPAPSALPQPPSAAAAAAATPAKDARKSKAGGKDRTVTGHSVTIAADEVVADLTVLGGSAEVFGTVTGDVSVFGGSMEIRDGAHVYGDVSVVGGAVDIATGAQVDGDVNCTGGEVKRGEQKTDRDHKAAVIVEHHKDKDSHKPKKSDDDGWSHESAGFLSTLGRTALLFAFGTVLLALLGPQMARLQSDFSERPTRAFALGAVGLAVGGLAVIALCITIIGIPVAIVAVLVGVLCVYAGICAVFTGLGAALLRHRSASPYVHLGVGCAIYCLLSSIPVIGSIVTIAAVLIGAGVLISTRAAGVFDTWRRDEAV